jgi:hypothetical protein
MVVGYGKVTLMKMDISTVLFIGLIIGTTKEIS